MPHGRGSSIMEVVKELSRIFSFLMRLLALSEI